MDGSIENIYCGDILLADIFSKDILTFSKWVQLELFRISVGKRHSLQSPLWVIDVI